MQNEVTNVFKVYAKMFLYVTICRHQRSKHDNKFIYNLILISHKQIDSRFFTKHCATYDIVVYQLKTQQFFDLQKSSRTRNAHMHQ